MYCIYGPFSKPNSIEATDHVEKTTDKHTEFQEKVNLYDV